MEDGEEPVSIPSSEGDGGHTAEAQRKAAPDFSRSDFHREARTRVCPGEPPQEMPLKAEHALVSEKTLL